jgi:hypothetical protein
MALQMHLMLESHITVVAFAILEMGFSEVPFHPVMIRVCFKALETHLGFRRILNMFLNGRKLRILSRESQLFLLSFLGSWWAHILVFIIIQWWLPP